MCTACGCWFTLLVAGIIPTAWKDMLASKSIIMLSYAMMSKPVGGQWVTYTYGVYMLCYIAVRTGYLQP